MTFCSSCLRISHVKSQCKDFSRYAHCANRSHEDNTGCPNINSSPICANCKGAHPSFNPFCPELFTHKQVRNLTASKNIPFAETKKIIRNNDSNVVRNPQFDFSNFPELSDSPTPDFFFFPLLPPLLPLLLFLSPTLTQ